MKRYISVFIIISLLLSALIGSGGTALAEGAPVIKLAPDTITGDAGDQANIEAQITCGSKELVGYSVVYNGDTLAATDATLNPGDSNSLNFSLTVTDSMLNAGSIKVQLYSGGNALASDTLKIYRKDISPAIGCTVKASQTLAATGDEIKFTFTMQNTGNVTLENINIKSDNLKKGALNPSPWPTLEQNKSIKWTYKYSFKKAMTVSFYITYTAKGSSGKYAVPQTFELKEEERKVVATLEADDKTPDPGQEVTFTLNITNKGNVKYTNLKVSWDGENIGSPSSTLNPEAVLEKQYKRTFDSSADVGFTITMKDHTGQTRSISTNVIQVLLPVDPAALQNGLKIVIEPDRDEFSSSGVVNFSGYISNDSEYSLKDVSITEPSIPQPVFSVSEMAGNTKLPITFSVDVNATATYTFVYSVKDRNDQVYTVNSEPMTITIQNSDIAVTDDPIEGAPVEVLPTKDGSSDPLLIWIIIAAVLVVLIIVVAVALVVLWRNGRSPARASKTTAPKAKKPARGGYSKSIRSRSFRDRNHF